MKVGRNAVINSNINNFCSPSKLTRAHITRINPDKSTFLNSNLLVSNILNHLSPTHQKTNQNQNDAYVNREIETLRTLKHQIQVKNKINRVHTLAKCRSQTSLNQMLSQERQIQKQVQQINIMKLEVNQKARDIMCRKQDTAYLGRNIFLEGQKFLKKMKQHHPVQKVNKIQATRMLMKERAKSKGRQHIQMLISQDVSQIANQSHGPKMLNSAQTSVQFDNSREKHTKKDNLMDKQKNRKLATMIKNQSYQAVLAQQKRLATWNGFTEHWAQGFAKNADLVVTKKKKRTKKSPGQKYLDISDNSQLNYHDKFSRHLSLKNFSQAFSKTAASCQIVAQ